MAEQTSVDWRPISNSLTHELAIPFNAVPPAVVPAAAEVSITRRWIEQGMPYISLSYPDATRRSDFLVRWVLQGEAGSYLVLEQPPMYWDPETQEPPQVLVRLSDSNTVVTLTEREEAKALSALQSDVLLRRDSKPAKAKEQFQSDVRTVLGALPQAGSPEHRAQDLGPTGLTNRLGLGTWVESGATIKIRYRWNIVGHLFVLLSNLEVGKQVFEFSIGWIVEHEGAKYLILQYPPEISADEDIAAKVAVRVLDQSTLETISDSDLKAIAVTCLTEMNARKKSEAEAVTAVLGTFPEWEEVQSEVETATLAQRTAL